MSLGWRDVAAFDRDVDGDDAFAFGLDDDRVEIERAERPGIRHREVAEPDQKRRQRFNVAASAASQLSSSSVKSRMSVHCFRILGIYRVRLFLTTI